jgi:cytochrome b pre-mRNA-processing protein 3
MIFTKIFKKKPYPATRAVYEAIVAAARRSAFYADFGVPDTVDGRFDMIALHGFLVLQRLKGELETESFSQALIDEIFRDMDRSLREMGAGDLSVGKKVRKMAEVFYGRLEAYREALAGPPGEQQIALQHVLARNVFAGSEGGSPKPIALYILKARDHLQGIDAGALMSGQFAFPDPAS